jgi:formamidopyrimidine-DNA glycosylase
MDWFDSHEHGARLNAWETGVSPMPELPDITVYIDALKARLLEQRLERCSIVSPFLLRTAQPPIETVQGRRVMNLRRMGKRIAIGLEGDLWLVLHLMIAGRLHWFDLGSPLSKRAVLARFEFTNGTLTLTEAGTKRRASLYLIQGELELAAQDPRGTEVLETSRAEFSARLKSENHTLKRSLTDPHLFSGIGNAYSDEILHAAKLSPVALSRSLSEDEITRLYLSAQGQLRLWIDRLRNLAGVKFPEGVTAFREGMAVHGRFGSPCPVCGTAVQRIRYADNETNYCPRCQTGGRLLADRALSRLLKKDWPRTIDAFEKQR